MRHEYKILGSFVFTILVGIFVLSFPRSGYSQAGCCLNPQGHCPPGQQTQPAGCNFPNPAGGAFIVGEVCNAAGTGCEAIPPTQTGCCQSTNSCQNDVEESTCTGGGGEFVLNGDCVDTSCTPLPPPKGCCQLSDSCNTDDSATCINEGGAFVNGGDCVGNLCNPQPPTPPTGCCVLGNSSCEVVTAGICQADNGDYQGDHTVCPGPPTCGSVTTIQTPTISQWGLIFVAGLLGLFSLVILIRRQHLT